MASGVVEDDAEVLAYLADAAQHGVAVGAERLAGGLGRAVVREVAVQRLAVLGAARLVAGGEVAQLGGYEAALALERLRQHGAVFVTRGLLPASSSALRLSTSLRMPY